MLYQLLVTKNKPLQQERIQIKMFPKVHSKST